MVVVPVVAVRATLLACESPSSGAPAAADPSICNADCRQRVDRKRFALRSAIEQRCGLRNLGVVLAIPHMSNGQRSLGGGARRTADRVQMHARRLSLCSALWTIPFVVSRSCGLAVVAQAHRQRIPPPLAWSHAHAHARKPLLIADGWLCGCAAQHSQGGQVRLR